MGAFIPASFAAVGLAPLSKKAIFYSVRLCLGLIGAACNTYLVRAVGRKYGEGASALTQLFLGVTPGMFISITSFLPSTFAMYCYTVMLAAWLDGDLVIAQHMVALAALVGWPFSILVGVPLALYIIVHRGLLFAIGHGVLSLLFFLVPTVLVDSLFYQKIVVAPLQIVLYNVFGNHPGPELYGVEPWYFYILNGFLNFNFVFFLALAAPLLLAIHAFFSKRWRAAWSAFVFISGAFIWLAYMSYVPHKEERFLFVIYPWICVAAALTLTCVTDILERVPPKIVGTVVGIGLTLIVAFSLARTVSLYYNYDAPMTIYAHLHDQESQMRPHEQIEIFSRPKSAGNFTYVCVGKEWYRFATHFFLPPHLRLAFLQDGFGGQLPQYYGTGDDATYRIPPHFNDLNMEEPSRYSDISICTYMVTFFEDDNAYHKFISTEEGHYNWEVDFGKPFLSVAHSPNSFLRAFYVPFFSDEANEFGYYALLKRKQE